MQARGTYGLHSAARNNVCEERSQSRCTPPIGAWHVSILLCDGICVAITQPRTVGSTLGVVLIGFRVSLMVQWRITVCAHMTRISCELTKGRSQQRANQTGKTALQTLTGGDSYMRSEGSHHGLDFKARNGTEISHSKGLGLPSQIPYWKSCICMGIVGFEDI